MIVERWEKKTYTHKKYKKSVSVTFEPLPNNYGESIVCIDCSLFIDRTEWTTVDLHTITEYNYLHSYSVSWNVYWNGTLTMKIQWRAGQFPINKIHYLFRLILSMCLSMTLNQVQVVCALDKNKMCKSIILMSNSCI